jgi:O-antigen/teichoic acid export membrane protein
MRKAFSMPLPSKLSPAQWFMVTVMLVNAGNYAYNLLLGRWLGPTIFADVALLITLLLVLSFVAMTIQLLAAKFVIELPDDKIDNFKKVVYKYALISGSLVGIVCMLNAQSLASMFQLKHDYVFYLFAAGIPIYFIMSVSRGLHQGKQQFIELSRSYLFEMLGRLSVTFVLIGFQLVEPTLAVALGILISFVFGLYPNQFTRNSVWSRSTLNKSESKAIVHFLLITAFYEGTQIVINNSDILIVKHYFDHLEAGLYASLALIGRVVYFVIWMLIMILLPKVIQAKKDGGNPQKILKSYIKFIIVLTTSLISLCYLFPETIITLLFGDAYISLGYLLYQYALATSLFALANLFVYYFLSLSSYKPVIMAMVFGLSQVVFLILFHKTLEQVVQIQIALMAGLLTVTLSYYFYQNWKQSKQKLA